MTSTITDRLYGESASVAIKAPCVSVSNGNPLPLVGLTTVGGYTPNPGDRILVKDQTDPTANGIYNASTGAWQRSGDFDGLYDCVQGTLIVVNYPNAGGTMYQLTTVNPVIGATALNFSLGGNITQALFDSFLGSCVFAGAVDSPPDVSFHRLSAQTGGTFGFVTPCVEVYTKTSPTGGNFEWALLAKIDNFSLASTNAQNVAFYAQGNKYSTGPTWGATIEVIERNAVNNPPQGTVGLEVDVSVNGTDNGGGSRVGLDLVIRKFDQAGVAGQANWGYRLQNGGDAVSNVGYGFSFAPGMIGNVGFDCSHGTILTAAYQMAPGQPIIFDGPTAQLNKLVYGGSGLDYLVNNVLQTRLMNTGGLQVGVSQVVGPRNTGWSLMTGTLDNASVFNTATVTLAQLASRVAALQNAFTNHGLIGT